MCLAQIRSVRPALLTAPLPRLKRQSPGAISSRLFHSPLLPYLADQVRPIHASRSTLYFNLRFQRRDPILDINRFPIGHRRLVDRTRR